MSAQVLMLHCFDLGAKLPFVCLAQPVGLGLGVKEIAGPMARTFVPAKYFTVSKRPDLRP